MYIYKSKHLSCSFLPFSLSPSSILPFHLTPPLFPSSSFLSTQFFLSSSHLFPYFLSTLPNSFSPSLPYPFSFPLFLTLLPILLHLFFTRSPSLSSSLSLPYSTFSSFLLSSLLLFALSSSPPFPPFSFLLFLFFSLLPFRLPSPLVTLPPFPQLGWRWTFQMQRF